MVRGREMRLASEYEPLCLFVVFVLGRDWTRKIGPEVDSLGWIWKTDDTTLATFLYSFKKVVGIIPALTE